MYNVYHWYKNHENTKFILKKIIGNEFSKWQYHTES